jgi:hypothetical protein
MRRGLTPLSTYSASCRRRNRISASRDLSGRGAAGDLGALAPRQIQAPVEVEVARWAAADPGGAARADPTDGEGKPAVGSGADCERVVGEARTAGLAADGAEVSAKAEVRVSARRSALDDVPCEPRSGHPGVRLLRHGDLHMALGPGVPDPPPAVPRSMPKSRHLLADFSSVRSTAVLGGLHHEYSLAAA